MVVGFDLGSYSVQISFYRSGMEAPETAEQIIGSQVFNIPMVLCKRTGVNQWFYGRDAIKRHEKGEGTLIDGILQKAIDGESETVEGEEIDAVALLTLFIKRSLSILGGARAGDSVSDIMFTCEILTSDVIDVMSRVADGLQLRNCNVYFQSYAESVYHYMIHQEREIWRDNVVCSYYDGLRVRDYIFRRNLKTSPIATFVDILEPFSMPFPQIITEDSRQSAYERLDAAYAEHIGDVLADISVSSVYLLGDGFKEDWYRSSTGVIARNRRVFVGNDLFSRGAAFCLQDKYEPSVESKDHIFLGVDKLRSNIGMNVLRRGRESYLALLDAGINWYDAVSEHELFVPEDGILHLEIIPLAGGGHSKRDIELYDLPERDPDTLRVGLTMSMSDVNTVNIHIEDLGFGDIFPSSGMVWDYTIEVS